jgi:hypothetical protein
MFSAGRGRRRNDDNDARPAGRVWCRICGRPVRSSVGEVCSKPSCHRAAMARGDR